MDYLEKYEAEQEARREFLDRQTMPQQADQRPRTDMPETDYPVTVIGCIRGVDGWYLAGYHSKTKTIKPLERI